jgi:hypothetical protein
VHYLLLEGADHPLADVYAGRSDADPSPLFLDICHTRRDDILAILAVRHIQTNECGRSAVIGPGLTWLASRREGPYSLVDVGASAGLNLLCDRYRMDYGAYGATGPADSPVTIACRVVAGHPPIARRLPTFASNVGIDLSPMDLTNPHDAQWLLACVWPDTGHLAHTEAAVKLAQSDPPRVIAGDATSTLAEVIAALPEGAVAVVVTSWAFAYLRIEDRQEFMRLLERESHARDIAWWSAEGAGTVEPFADQAVPDDDQRAANILGAILFKNGVRDPHLLGYVQEHGAWIDWRAD